MLFLLLCGRDAVSTFESLLPAARMLALLLRDGVVSAAVSRGVPAFETRFKIPRGVPNGELRMRRASARREASRSMLVLPDFGVAVPSCTRTAAENRTAARSLARARFQFALPQISTLLQQSKYTALRYTARGGG